MTIVCGDSHTATHGAFGALAFGIGTSEVEHVLATQCLVQRKPRSMRISYERRAGLRRHRQGPDPRDDRPDGRRGRGRPRRRVRRARDRGALDGGPHDDLQHDDRGRRPRGHDRAGRDDVRVGAGPPRGAAGRGLRRDGRALARPAQRRRARRSTPRSTSTSARSARWSPGARTPRWSSASATPSRSLRRDGDERALEYMGLEAGTPIEEIRLDRVFIGSCTNSRIGDLRVGRRGREGPQGPLGRLRDGRPGLRPGEAPGRGGGPRRGLPRGRLRLARRRLLDVPGDEPGHPQARRALRLDLQPQLRGPPGTRRPHPPRQPADGRRRGDRGPLRRHHGAGD